MDEMEETGISTGLSEDEVDHSSDEDMGVPKLYHEKSRSQYLVRTGAKGPGQSLQLKYTSDAEKREADARDKRLVRRLFKQRRMPIPHKYLDLD